MTTDQPRRAMTMREIREALGHKISEPPTTPSAPTDWVDGHPQLEAIAAAVWEKCGRSDSGMCVEDDPRNIAVAALAAYARRGERPGAVLRRALLLLARADGVLDIRGRVPQPRRRP
ncbi:hypothetical protein ACFWHL_16305 [Streptomyces massasporeus]